MTVMSGTRLWNMKARREAYVLKAWIRADGTEVYAVRFTLNGRSRVKFVRVR